MLHRHTHCQAAQSNAQTQAWQRVCLSQRSTEPTVKRTNEEEARCPNSVYVAIAGEVVNRRSVLLRNFVLNGMESASIRYFTYTQNVRCKWRTDIP